MGLVQCATRPKSKLEGVTMKGNNEKETALHRPSMSSTKINKWTVTGIVEAKLTVLLAEHRIWFPSDCGLDTHHLPLPSRKMRAQQQAKSKRRQMRKKSKLVGSTHDKMSSSMTHSHFDVSCKQG